MQQCMQTLSLGMSLLQLRLDDLKETARNWQGTCSEHNSILPHAVLLVLVLLLLLLLLLPVGRGYPSPKFL